MTPPSRKQLFLHVGYHKTATTTIQYLLNCHRDRLADYGYLYPKTGLINDGQHSIAWQMANPSSYLISKEHGSIEQLLDEIRSSSLDRVILSSEDFIFVDPAYVKQIFQEFQVKVIVFLRDPVQWLLSLWKEISKAGNVISLYEWSQNVLDHLARHEFSQNVSFFYSFKYFNFAVTLDEWETAFGNNNLIVRKFLKESSASVEQFFECCELPADFLQANDISMPTLNDSMSDDEIGLCLGLNRITEQLPISPEERHNLSRDLTHVLLSSKHVADGNVSSVLEQAPTDPKSDPAMVCDIRHLNFDVLRQINAAIEQRYQCSLNISESELQTFQNNCLKFEAIANRPPLYHVLPIVTELIQRYTAKKAFYDNELSLLLGSMGNTQAYLSDLEQQHNRANQQIQALRSEIQRLENDLQFCRGNRQRLQEAIDDMQASPLWRVKSKLGRLKKVFQSAMNL